MELRVVACGCVKLRVVACGWGGRLSFLLVRERERESERERERERKRECVCDPLSRQLERDREARTGFFSFKEQARKNRERQKFASSSGPPESACVRE